MVFIIVMGVCGSGKTTIARKLGKKMNCLVLDADDFHSQDNKTKMNQNIPLTDEDRVPWLMSIHNHIKREVNEQRDGVIACSALKKNYRHILLNGNGSQEEISSSCDVDNVLFVFLRGSMQMIKERMLNRQDHFMPASLLQSQFDILEEPDDSENCFIADITFSPDEIVLLVTDYLSIKSNCIGPS